MYPWLLNGTVSIGGNSSRPTNLKSFCGGFINMVFMVSSMLSGACATPEFLMYMDYFIRKDYGDNYIFLLADNSCISSSLYVIQLSGMETKDEIVSILYRGAKMMM